MIEGLVMVYTFWLVMVASGQLTGSSSWVVVTCWVVVILGAGFGCRWLLAFAAICFWAVLGHHSVWVLVIGCGCCLSVAVCSHWCSWAVVVCNCKWPLWVVIAIHHVGSCCWSLHVLLLVVRSRKATSHCQTNIACYPSQLIAK